MSYISFIKIMKKITQMQEKIIHMSIFNQVNYNQMKKKSFYKKYNLSMFDKLM
jgi:hypothetical protein